MESPVVSVVMPTWNRADKIKHPITSILLQGFKDWELIIVDDGSTDGTEKEVGRFLGKGWDVRYFKIKHTGRIGRVRNYGNSRARGELIVVQDDDDISYPDRLSVIWDEYKKTNADVLYHGSYFTFYDEDQKIIQRKWQPAQPFNRDKIIFHQYIPGQVAYKRSAILKTPYDNRLYCCDDWQVLLELALKNYKFHPINQSLYEYWYHEGSVNVLGEADGRRLHDTKIIMEILRKKYNIQVIAAETNKIDLKTGKRIKHEKIK